MDIKAVIFDLDGTLIDSMGVWVKVDKEYLKKRDITPPENLFDDVKSGNSFTEIAVYFKEKFNLPDTIEEIMTEWILMVEEHYKNRIELRPGVKNFLELLHENKIKTAIGTSNELQLTELVLKSHGIFDYFDVIVSGCKGIKGKPYPDIFLEAASLIDVKPEHCLVIEDTLVGVEAALNAEMTVFAIEDKQASGDRTIIKEKADYFAKTFDQIEIEFMNRFSL